MQQEGRKCVLCEFHKQDCTFVENAQPRKRKLDDSAKKDSPAKRSPVNTRPSSPSRTQQQQQQPPQPVVEQIDDTPQTNTSSFSVVDESLSLQRHRHCRYIGQTTTLDSSIIGLDDFTHNEAQSRLGKLRKVAEAEYFSTYEDADVPIPDDEARALAEIQQVVGRHGPALIDIYFRNVHPGFPIIQRQTFLQRFNNNDMHFNPPLLAAMYLLAIAWWSEEPSVSNSPFLDTARLEYIAITSLTVSMQRPKMSAVQAGLLLLQRPKSNTWTLTVQLVALAQEIGLHLDCTDWLIPEWEKRLRKRLAWSLYMQDKWSAVTHGRPSHINAADWNVPAPVEEDFDEALPSHSTTANDEANEEDVLQGRAVFMQMIDLTKIMAEVCDTFYSEAAKNAFARAGHTSTQLVLARAKPVQIKLKDWFAHLPQQCKIDSYTPGRRCPNGYLHLAYFATEISIHRRIVQSLDPARADPYLLYICRSAAKTRLISAMDVVNRLKPEHLDAFWYFASASNFALIATFGALLQATSPGDEEATFYACRLNEFGWTLRVSAEKAPWLQSALDSLVANAAILQKVPRTSAVADAQEGEKMGRTHARRDSHAEMDLDDDNE